MPSTVAQRAIRRPRKPILPALRTAVRAERARETVAQSSQCVVCGRELKPQHEPDLLYCVGCRYVGSRFAATESGAMVTARLDETQRRKALEALRRASANKILDVLARYRSLDGARLCDVGCGYGWFLDEARRRGALAVGIEPDLPVAQATIEKRHEVRIGEFPRALLPTERFDVIAFNDVLEHLDDVEGMLVACRRHLITGGLLAVALPTSAATMYRMACALRRWGVRGPLDRLWQRGYPSPHRHYFDGDNLRRLVERFGFSLAHTRPLPAWRLAGLWSRLRMDGARPRWQSALTWTALAAAYPLVRQLPSDILLQVYRSVDQPAD